MKRYLYKTKRVKWVSIRVGAPSSSPVLGDVPSLEIPLQPRFAADDFAGVPPMFPRLPGALETT